MTKQIFFKLQFIDNSRFLENSLLNILDYLVNELIKFSVNMGMMIKNTRCAELNAKNVNAVLNVKTFRMIEQYANVCSVK